MSSTSFLRSAHYAHAVAVRDHLIAADLVNEELVSILSPKRTFMLQNYRVKEETYVPFFLYAGPATCADQ